MEAREHALGERAGGRDHEVHVDGQWLLGVRPHQEIEVALERGIEIDETGRGKEAGVVRVGHATCGEGLGPPAERRHHVIVRQRRHPCQQRLVGSLEQDPRGCLVLPSHDS
jgi:hypothetical protein